MSRKYKFHNPEGTYFVSFAIEGWIDVFTRKAYKTIFLEIVAFYQKNQKLEIFAYCIMSNHVHLVFRSLEKTPQQMIANIKRSSSKRILKSIEDNIRESRRDWMLKYFSEAANRYANVTNYKLWRHDNRPIEVWTTKVVMQKINYIHQNPVKAGIVGRAEDYLYSSARDYVGGTGCLEGVIVLD